MPIPDVQTMTNRGWVEAGGLPPGFYFTTAARPHLHLGTSGTPTGPWYVAYLGFTTVHGTTEIIWLNGTAYNQAALAHVPATHYNEAVVIWNTWVLDHQSDMADDGTQEPPEIIPSDESLSG